MKNDAIQDQYPDDYAHCYGCGRLNEHGLHIKSHWEGNECICRFRPATFYTGGFPGFLYGGMIASLIDCHSAGTAAGARQIEDRKNDPNAPPRRFVTASLKVDYLKPTPVNAELELRSTVEEIKGRKIIVSTDVYVSKQLRAKGSAVMVQIPEDYQQTVND